MERNLSKQINDRILEVNHRCWSESLLKILESNGSPSLSVNVVVDWYDIDPNWNKEFWAHKIYVKPEKLNLGENFILLWKDFHSWYYDDINELINDLEKRIDNYYEINEYLFSWIYYPEYGFIWYSEYYSYNAVEKFTQEYYIIDTLKYLFKRMYNDIYTDDELSIIEQIITNIWDDNLDYIYDIKIALAKSILIILRNIYDWYDIETTFKAAYYTLDEFFWPIKKNIKNTIITYMDEIENKEGENINWVYDIYLSIYKKINEVTNMDVKSIEALLNNILVIPQAYTEWKILMRKVPLNFWEKVEIDSNNFREILSESDRNKTIDLLERNNISYEFV